MKILICGMPRSTTTWAFNVLRELVSNPDLQTVWIEPTAEQAETDFATGETDFLAKCHHYSGRLAASADLIVYSYRDIRTAAVSYHRKFHSYCTQGQLDGWVASGRAWLPRAQIVLRYESVERQPLEAICRLRRVLVHRFGEDAVAATSDEEVLRRVNTAFERCQKPTEIVYDNTTMITPGHRTYQPHPTELAGSDPGLYDRVEREFAVWLADYGYVHSDDHGQELEYQIANHLLKSLDAPVVVDVGVERGSFTQLACEAGATRVVGFEPLPRHLDYLAHKYAGIYQVEIQPFAVSSQSGQAQLHVATDLEGNELNFHHTLSDLGDSATVIRSGKTLEVKTVSLADLATQGQFPSGIDFLKIDTDGHDLSVLEGLGGLRPRIILAEYWDSLPDTSGKNIYSLNDLTHWARSHGYERTIVVRRHARIELVELEAPLTLPGDWGNVFFLRQDFDFERVRPAIENFIRTAYENLCNYVSGLERDCEAKEAEIQHLAAAVRQSSHAYSANQTVDTVVSPPTDGQQQSPVPNTDLTFQLAETTARIQCLMADLRAAHTAQIEKEEVISALANTVMAYRLAYLAIKPLGMLLSPLKVIARHGRAMLRPRLGNLNQYPAQALTPTKILPCATQLSAMPTISIVTPSFRQGVFIERTLLSVFDQNYPNLEYFVQDGGSQDRTVAVLEKHADRLSGWVSEKDSGQSQAINRGFAKTSGEIMGWLNSDDLLLPGALTTVADYFNRHPEVDVLYGNRLLIDENDMEIGRWIMPGHDNAALSWVDYIPQETLFWRRRIWDKVGGQIDESFRFAMDWDLLVRFRDAGARFAHIPRFMGAFRIHEHQKTSANINDFGHQEMDRIRERLLGRIPSSKEIRNAALPYLLKHVAIDLAYRVKARLRTR